MATKIQPPAAAPVDYEKAEGLHEAPAEHVHGFDRATERREWTFVAIGLTALVAVLAMVVGIFAFATGGDDDATSAAPVAATPAAAAPAPASDTAAAPTLKDAKGVAFEKFERVDPTLPAPVTKVDVDVYQHVTQVSKDLAPTEVWSYAINGKYIRGTGVSAPIVVEQGTTVDFKLTNGTDKSMKVDLPHSLDFHSAEVNPGTRYADLAPGESMSYEFDAKHAGVFMYHCATQPVLMHTGAGMVGMMVVKPKNLPAVDRELWITQQEYYIGKPGKDADMAKMEANKPDVIAFNGFANQYKDHPITVKKDEKIRMYVLNAGPSVWSAFHVIGTVFDRTVIEGQVGRSAQTVNLAPSQGGWVEFTLDEEGTFPFVNHSFGNMVKGSLGVLATENPPKGAGHSH
jgi:nitrite reductase (NO-forming)